MLNHSLIAVVKLKTHYNNLAKKHLANSLNNLNVHNKKIQKLNAELTQIKKNRTKDKDSFFDYNGKPLNTFELENQQNLLSKNLHKEVNIYESLMEQEKQYLMAKNRYYDAQKLLIKTKQELKIIEKLCQIQKDKKFKAYSLQMENQLDEINIHRFIARLKSQ